MRAAGCRGEDSHAHGRALLMVLMVQFLGTAGGVCLVVVVFTHVAEQWGILPSMGWGLPNSPGHYLDLFSAVAGIVLLLASYLIYRRRTRIARLAKPSDPRARR
jgi:hypothetical protein